jgi:hypothetical protein
MAKVLLAKHNDMVKAIPPDRTDEPLRISVLPWRPRRNRPIPYAHCSKTSDEGIAIDAIPIANDISWRLLPAVGLGALTGNPLGTRCAVTPSHRISRRLCCRIRNPYNSRNEIVGTTNISIDAIPSA